MIEPTIEEALHAAIAAKCRELKCEPIAVGGIHDHVHILVELRPAVSVVKQYVLNQKQHHAEHTLQPEWEHSNQSFQPHEGGAL